MIASVNFVRQLYFTEGSYTGTEYNERMYPNEQRIYRNLAAC